MILSLNLVAIINLTLFGIIFLFRKSNLRQSFLLSFLFIAPVFAQLFNTLVYLDKAHIYPISICLSLTLNLLWGPCFYFYALSIIRPGIRFKIFDTFHTVPAIIGLMYSIWVMLLPDKEQYNFFVSIKQQVPKSLMMVNALMIFQIFGYFIFTYFVVRSNRKKLNNSSNVYPLSFKWIEEFIIISLILALIAFIPMLVLPQLKSFLIYLPICSSLSYVFIVFNYIKYPVIFTTGADETKTSEKNTKVNNDRQSPELSSTLPENPDNNTSITLESFIQEKKLFLNPELNISYLSKEVGISVHQLSEIINTCYKKNFFDFINSYRIEEAKKLLAEPENQKLKIDTIAELSGFNSRSTFYSAFKKNTGLTPQEFKNSLLKSVG